MNPNLQWAVAMATSAPVRQQKPFSSQSKKIKSPMEVTLTKRFLIADHPKTRSKKPFWMNLRIGDVIELSIVLKETGSNRGKTTQSICLVINERTGEDYLGYPVNVLRYLKNLQMNNI
jgi:hypothetical protein